MIAKTAETAFGRWSAPQIALSVEYRLDVMEQIRSASLEVAGILFGTHQDDSVRITAWRPISREHAEGSGLILSANGRRDLVRSLLAAKQDPELQSLQPVGWFVSHTSGDISLSAPDIEIFDGFFGEPWQVTLVLLPTLGGAVRAGFFVRDPSGKLQSGSSYREFTIEPPASRPRFVYWRWLWAIPTLLAAILAGVLIKPQHPEPVNPGFALRIQGDGPISQIHWDTNSPSVRAASRAEIDIQDGVGRPSHFPITGAQLNAGKMTWPRHSADLQVRMTVYLASGAVVRESAHLLVATVSAPPDPQPDPHTAELKKLNDELHQERVRSDKLQKMVKILENRIDVDGARKPN